MQNKENTSSLNSNDNETYSFTNINNINSDKNQLKNPDYSLNFCNEFSKNKSLAQLVNDMINQENFEMFKLLFNDNKGELLKSFYEISKPKANVDQSNNQFTYLLHVCTNNNLYKFVELILIEFRNFIEKNIKKETLYDSANNIDIAGEEYSEKLFSNFVNAIDNLGYTPIHYAIISGNIKLINVLIDNKADVSIRTKNGYTCLHLAASIDKLEIFLFLYENYKSYLDLNDKDNQNNSILHIVCYHGSYDVFDFLLSKKINLNAIDNKGNCPLHYAVFNGNIIKITFNQ